MLNILFVAHHSFLFDDIFSGQRSSRVRKPVCYRDTTPIAAQVPITSASASVSKRKYTRKSRAHRQSKATKASKAPKLTAAHASRKLRSSSSLISIDETYFDEENCNVYEDYNFQHGNDQSELRCDRNQRNTSIKSNTEKKTVELAPLTHQDRDRTQSCGQQCNDLMNSSNQDGNTTMQPAIQQGINTMPPWNQQGGNTMQPWNQQGGNTMQPWNQQGSSTMQPWKKQGNNAMPP